MKLNPWSWLVRRIARKFVAREFSASFLSLGETPVGFRTIVYVASFEPPLQVGLVLGVCLGDGSEAFLCFSVEKAAEMARALKRGAKLAKDANASALAAREQNDALEVERDCAVLP